MIPIILLHHNEFEYLLQAIVAIKSRTDYPYKIIVIDNKSDFRTQFWDQLISGYNVEVIFNRKNDWICGFNLGINVIKSDYYALSDSDIVVPERVNGVCWLTYLKSQMLEYPMIGKIGLSLDLENLKNNREFMKLYLKENEFKKGLKIGDNIIAPVDSTMALYRSDLYIHGFKMRIGHMRLLKPYYFCVRTGYSHNAIHLGWDTYRSLVQYSDLNDLRKKLNLKV
jgi:hypothetical protein